MHPATLHAPGPLVPRQFSCASLLSPLYMVARHTVLCRMCCAFVPARASAIPSAIAVAAYRTRCPQRLQRHHAQAQSPAQASQASAKTGDDGMRMVALPAPVERTANGASEPANGTSSRRNGNGASVNDRAQQPSSHQSSKVIMSQRVPTGPLLRNAAQQAANVLQERREGVLLGGSDTPADSGFDWANSSYDRKSRGIRIWLYAIDLRVSLALLDQKWSYLLGVPSITANAEPTHRFHHTCAMHNSSRRTLQ